MRRNDMTKIDKEELIIDALIDTLTLFYEAGYEGTDKCNTIQTMADDIFNEWISIPKKH